jgi:hypothetical protein
MIKKAMIKEELIRGCPRDTYYTSGKIYDVWYYDTMGSSIILYRLVRNDGETQTINKDWLIFVDAIDDTTIWEEVL